MRPVPRGPDTRAFEEEPSGGAALARRLAAEVGRRPSARQLLVFPISRISLNTFHFPLSVEQVLKLDSPTPESLMAFFTHLPWGCCCLAGWQRPRPHTPVAAAGGSPSTLGT